RHRPRAVPLQRRDDTDGLPVERRAGGGEGGRRDFHHAARLQCPGRHGPGRAYRGRQRRLCPDCCPSGGGATPAVRIAADLAAYASVLFAARLPRFYESARVRVPFDVAGMVRGMTYVNCAAAITV